MIDLIFLFSPLIPTLIFQEGCSPFSTTIIFIEKILVDNQMLLSIWVHNLFYCFLLPPTPLRYKTNHSLEEGVTTIGVGEEVDWSQPPRILVPYLLPTSTRIDHAHHCSFPLQNPFISKKLQSFSPAIASLPFSKTESGTMIPPFLCIKKTVHLETC